MLKDLHELYSLLTRRQRRRLLRLQVLIILMALAEIASVVSIGPFMAVVGDMGRLQGEGWLAAAFAQSGLESPRTFLAWLGVAVFGVLLATGLLSIYTTWRLSLFSSQVGAELSTRLYRHYLYQPWLFHTGHSSSRLIHRASQEVQRVTHRILAPALQLNSRLVMVTLMTLTVLFIDPVVALSGMAIFLGAYLLLYKTVRRFLVANGKRVSQTQSRRLTLMAEGFGGIKDLLLMHHQPNFVRRFEAASLEGARCQGVTQGLSDAPRYAIEMVAFGSILLLVLYYLVQYQGDLGMILPALSIYALAGFKMLPAYQRIYSAVSTIRGNLASFEALRKDLRASQSPPETTAAVDNPVPLVPERSILLRDLGFHYPGKQEPALDGLTLEIPVNRMVGLVGESGSGKSTLVDMLLGLLSPERGEILLDGRPLAADDMPRWQAGVGFVPQQIFLADTSILENVAFGIEPERIDVARVWEALGMAQLREVVEALPTGIHTRVGERGVQLSGGQRQRIGIARALYRQARVLVLDEATSALDGITEGRVMADIQRFTGQMTIVLVAHRLATVRACDVIYLIHGGRVVDAGTYDDLVERNATFQKMAHL